MKKHYKCLDENEEVSILLGNGFSQAWNAEIFNYQNLFEAADFGENHEAIKAIFNRFETYDFETVMGKMLGTISVLEEYKISKEIIHIIQKDSVSLKTALINAIAQTHPSIPNDIEDAKYICARKFLSKFNNIFSLNYDLLMYWARNKNGLAPINFKSDDGFRAGRKWRDYGTNQNVHFLHGGLHIYYIGTSLLKHAHIENEATIIDLVRKNLETNKFPLFVSEPTYKKKLLKIERNPYLNFCYKALQSVSGTIFIYGHSINETDKHIFDAIKKSSASTVIVSIYGDPNSEVNLCTQANARAYMENQNLSVVFFDASSTPIWSEF